MTYSNNIRHKVNKVFKRAITVVGAAGVALAAAALPASADVSSSSDTMPSFNGTVLATAYAGSTIYVGGNFTTALVDGRPVARNRLAAIDALTGELLPWAPTVDDRVKAIVTNGSSVYIAGDFGTVNGTKRDSLARIDGTSGTLSNTFKHSIKGSPYALAAHRGRLYLGGAITEVDGQTRTRLAAFSLTSGALDPTWKPTADDQVEAITAYGDRVYVGGKFHKLNGVGGYPRLAALNPISGAIVTTFKPKAAVVTFGIAVNSSGVFSAHGGRGGKVNAYTTLGALRWSATFDGDAQAVAVLGGTVYAGGHFDEVCKTADIGDQGACLDGSVDRVKLAALSVSNGKLKSWRTDANGVVGVLSMTGNATLGTILVGGAFTTINGESQKRLAQFS